MALLYGIHDIEAASVVPTGGWCLDTIAISENPPPKSYDSRLNWLGRLNWGYGSTGTIPVLSELSLYTMAAGEYVARTSGCNRWIVGNEPNHEAERPNGVYITPEHYVECFVRVRNILKNISSKHQVIVAACAPYHANPTNWLMYWKQVLDRLTKVGGCDGLSIHAYTRGQEPSAVTSEEKMGSVLAGQYNGFRTYRDALSVVPASMLHLPVYITEYNPIPDWENRDTYQVRAAYREINEWNQVKKNQKVHCLLLFRWNSFPGQRFGIQNKPDVIRDFQNAVLEGFQSPQEGSDSTKDTKVVLPHINTGTPPSSPSAAFERDIDIRAKQRGVSILEQPVRDGKPVWKVKSIRWLDERESQGRYHFYFETLDESGKRVTGVPINVTWSTGNTIVTSEAKPGEPYSANFPMSPGQNAFAAIIMDGTLSEMVRGVGMGADTPDGYNPGIHTSTVVTFQRIKEMLNIPKPPTVSKATVPALTHPVADPRYRIITQRWGENPAEYSKFKVDGVALRGHNGLDFGTPINTNIVSVDHGRVIELADDPTGYGLYVKIKHNWGESLYAHLQSTLVKMDSTVNKGQIVGKSGNSGNSTGPHLHFAMRVNPYDRKDGWGGFSNPELYIKDAQVAPAPTAPSATSILGAIRTAASEHHLDWELLASLAWAESSFRPGIPDGLFQIGADTWKDWASRVGATDIYRPLDNSRVAAVYLKWLLTTLDNNLYKALIAYNFGIGNVLSGVQAPITTLNYVDKVMHGRDLLQAIALQEKIK